MCIRDRYSSLWPPRPPPCRPANLALRPPSHVARHPGHQPGLHRGPPHAPCGQGWSPTPPAPLGRPY
eukprot:10912326-Alexandrium_andersonii.AAC.1